MCRGYAVPALGQVFPNRLPKPWLTVERERLFMNMAGEEEAWLGKHS
ncbi:MAG: hypothetical protein QXI42_01070 [Thermoproteota archaeon]|nr:hypothetical protein [Candidatus Brockarchaeota archaeon]